MNTRKTIISHFFNNVKNSLGYYDWKLNFVIGSSEGHCWHKTKTIDIGLTCKDLELLVLHEISHIDTCRFCNNKHNITFWYRYEDLIRRFNKHSPMPRRYNLEGGHYKFTRNQTV